jgi:MATE family multidrug resistance protein
VFANFSAILGTAVLAANSLLLRILSVASFAIDGAAFAVETLAGTMLGRRDAGGLRRLHRMALVTGEAFALPLIAVVVAFPEAVFGVLTSHADVVRDASALAPWLVPVIGIGAIAYMYDGLFLGLTEGRRLRNAMLASAVFVFLPLAWAARVLENNSLLWGALAAFMVARVVTLGFVWIRESRRSMFGTCAPIADR